MDINRNSSADIIKIILITLVIISHAGLPYFIGPNGLWYFRSSTYNPAFFSPWNFSFNAFIINTLFFLSGFFSYYSIKKYKPRKFLIKRLNRLLIPLIFGFLFIIPPLSYYYFINYQPVAKTSFLPYLMNYWFGFSPRPDDWIGHYPDMNLGHLWFLEHLIIYSLLLALLFYFLNKINFRPIKINFTVFMVVLSIFSFSLTIIMKTYHPLTEMTSFLGFIQIDYTHTGQNFLLFFAGVLSYYFDYFSIIPYFFKKVIFFSGLILAVFPFIIFYFIPNLSFLFEDLVFFSFWESLTAILFSVGSLSYLQIKFNYNSDSLKSLGNSTYFVYIIHVVFVVFFQVVTESLTSNLMTRFISVSFFSIISTFSFSQLIAIIRMKTIKIKPKKFKSFQKKIS